MLCTCSSFKTLYDVCLPSSRSLSLSISRFQLDLVVVVKADSLVTTLIVTNKNREDNNSCRHC